MVFEETIDVYSNEEIEQAVVDYYKGNNSEYEDIINSFVREYKENPSINTIIKIFEQTLTVEEQVDDAAYYTPPSIAKEIINQTEIKPPLCDPACGSGVFLVRAAEYLHKKTNKRMKDILQNDIYGVDISQTSVRRAKIVLQLFAETYGINIKKEELSIEQADSLRSDFHSLFPSVFPEGFLSIVSNPPFIRIQDISEKERNYLKSNYKTVDTGNFNLFFPFIEKAFNITSNTARIGYLIPSNYFTTVSSKSLRSYLCDRDDIRLIVNFGDSLLFNDASTYTCVTIWDKERKEDYFHYTLTTPDNFISRNFDTVPISYNRLDESKWRMLSKEDYESIKQIESFRRLDEICDIRAGVATLSNSLYTVEETGNKDYYTTTYNGNKYLVEKEICEEFIKIVDINSQDDLENNDTYIITPYKKMTQQTLSLEPSSYNRSIIPEDELRSNYPKAYDYLYSIKDELQKRDGGDAIDYSPWYKFGREQGLGYYGERLYTPTYSKKPNFVHHENTDAFFANGYGLFPIDEDIEFLQEVLNSPIMDYYIRKTSRVIDGGYYCYQKNFMKTFSIPSFTEDEKKKIIQGSEQEKLNILVENYELDGQRQIR